MPVQCGEPWLSLESRSRGGFKTICVRRKNRWFRRPSSARPWGRLSSALQTQVERELAPHRAKLRESRSGRDFRGGRHVRDLFAGSGSTWMRQGSGYARSERDKKFRVLRTRHQAIPKLVAIRTSRKRVDVDPMFRKLASPSSRERFEDSPREASSRRRRRHLGDTLSKDIGSSTARVRSMSERTRRHTAMIARSNGYQCSALFSCLIDALRACLTQLRNRRRTTRSDAR